MIERVSTWRGWLQEQLEQRELGASQLDRTVAAPDGVCDRVEHQVLEAQRVPGLVSVRPAQQRAHAREQLLQRERLDEVVVRAGVEAAHAVGDRVARCQHENRRAVAGGAHPAADLEPVDVRHQQIEHEHVGRRGCDHVERRAPVRGERHVVSVQPQGAVDGIAHGGLVVDHEDAHRDSDGPPPS